MPTQIQGEHLDNIQERKQCLINNSYLGLTRSLLLEVVRLSEDLHEVFAHVVGALRRAVVAFAVLEEGQEQCVHGDLVHGEERRCDEVRG